VIFLLVWVTSLFIATATPRRDHADRSIEFWLSLPTSHSESLAAPLLVHLLLVPAAALLAGLACGLVVSLVTVGRVVSLGEWFSLPWGSLAMGMAALVARVMAGLPLATLWMLPLLLAAMLANAFFKRWGLPVLAVGLSLGSAVLKLVFGQPMLSNTMRDLVINAGKALMGASGPVASASARKTRPAKPCRPCPALPCMTWALHSRPRPRRCSWAPCWCRPPSSTAWCCGASAGLARTADPSRSRLLLRLLQHDAFVAQALHCGFHALLQTRHLGLDALHHGLHQTRHVVLHDRH
jgi:hypothetical protein